VTKSQRYEAKNWAKISVPDDDINICHYYCGHLGHFHKALKKTTLMSNHIATKCSNNFNNFLDESIYTKETKHAQNKQTTRDEKHPDSDVFQYGETGSGFPF